MKAVKALENQWRQAFCSSAEYKVKARVADVKSKIVKIIRRKADLFKRAEV
jgi:hypothetical protein